MKKIKHGRIYDTETARFIGGDYYGSSDNLAHWEEKLYRKRTGEFFLYGTGGPDSRYSRAISYNEWTGDEDIIPLTEDEAKKWAEEHLDACAYLKIFPIANDGNKRITSLSLSTIAFEKLKEESSKRKMSASQLIESMVMDL